MEKAAGSVGNAVFRTTHWTAVLEAAHPDSPDGQHALAGLYSDYWHPLYAFIRRRGFGPHEAEDITQDFFARLIEKQGLLSLQRDGGKFRSFLLRAVSNFLANEWDRQQAQKRGGGARHLSLNADEEENRFAAIDIPDHATPEVLFEREWVLTLLNRVQNQLREEVSPSMRPGMFEDLRPHLQGDRTGMAYVDIAARYGSSEGAVKVAVHRLRQRYGLLLREEVARTVSSAAEVDEELRHLINLVGQ